MSTLILVHILTGLAGIASGLIVVAGILCRKRVVAWSHIFISTTAASCATGFVWLPSDGVTSAQLVGFFVVFLLAVSAYARYGKKLEGGWNQVYAFTTVGALFLDILITTAQSFLHFQLLKALAPTQHSPVYIGVKITLLVLFVFVALVAARRAGRS